MSIWKRLFGSSGSSSSSEPAQTPSTAQLEEAYAKAIQVLQEHKRIAHIPVTKSVPSQFSADSKFGGYPYLRNKEDWPVCPNCSNHMQLFLQLNQEYLPVNKGKGLVQLFYCTNEEPHCEVDLEAYLPFSKGAVCRIVIPEGDSAIVEPRMQEVFDENKVVAWKTEDDYPMYDEYDDLGIELEFEDEVLELLDQREKCQTVDGDKLLGWPYWVQGPEYPDDRYSSNRMNVLFQLDSEINLPYMFGDSGIGHLSQSVDDKNQLAFGWACY
ncbi:MAG: DUF1963 domain-containing protein [Bacteroidia bacterium]|nr:DUF1963 domain-containing protein [Bacteroidia bacterium]